MLSGCFGHGRNVESTEMADYFLKSFFNLVIFDVFPLDR